MLKEDLRQLLPVLFWVEWGIGHEHVHVLGLQVELIEDVAPHELHVVPVLDDSPFDRLKDLMGLLRLECGVTECVGFLLFLDIVGVLVSHSIIDGFNMLSDDRGNDQPGEVLAGETCFDEACSVVDDDELFLVEEDLHLL